MTIQLHSVRYEKNLSQYYIDVLIPLADDAFQFAYILTLNREWAQKLIEWSYIELATDLEDIVGKNEPIPYILKECWKRYGSLSKKSLMPDDASWVKSLSGFSDVQRAIYYLADILELESDAVADILSGVSQDDIQKHLIEVRRSLYKLS